MIERSRGVVLGGEEPFAVTSLPGHRHWDIFEEQCRGADARGNLVTDAHLAALAVETASDIFDHRRMSVERIVAEASSWGVIRERQAETVVTETLASFDSAVTHIEPPKGVSRGLVERLQWNVRRLIAGSEISQPKR